MKFQTRKSYLPQREETMSSIQDTARQEVKKEKKSRAKGEC